MKCVIDASVVAKLFIPEELSEACEKGRPRFRSIDCSRPALD